MTFTVFFEVDGRWFIANTGLDRHRALALAEKLERAGRVVHIEPL